MITVLLRWRSNLRLTALVIALAAAAVPASLAAGEPAADSVAMLARFIEDVAGRQDPRVADALARIDGTGRRLLALRSYLRSRDHLGERWSWSQEQIAAYEGSPEHRELQLEIERVQEAFTGENPGFELWVNPQVRSLDVQLESWNSNESVTAAAANLSAAAREFVDSPTFRAMDTERARQALESFLAAHRPEPTPTVAAPGLSPHGQMRAIDFQVHQGDRIVAGPTTATMTADWDAAGWAARLDAAVRAASNRFVGPLASPREPWHYTFSPEAVAAQ